MDAIVWPVKMPDNILTLHVARTSSPFTTFSLPHLHEGGMGSGHSALPNTSFHPTSPNVPSLQVKEPMRCDALVLSNMQ